VSAVLSGFRSRLPSHRENYIAGEPALPWALALAICIKIREVTGRRSSNPFIFGLWLSLVERLVRDQEAVGSNPTSPISNFSTPSW
jgi:hypothetical protein